jgi:hypothetical protein
MAASAALVDRIRGEFNEMPGLQLTIAQAARLWGMEAGACRTIVDALVDASFLRWTRTGTVVRGDVRSDARGDARGDIRKDIRTDIQNEARGQVPGDGRIDAAGAVTGGAGSGAFAVQQLTGLFGRFPHQESHLRV